MDTGKSKNLDGRINCPPQNDALPHESNQKEASNNCAEVVKNPSFTPEEEGRMTIVFFPGHRLAMLLVGGPVRPRKV